MNNHESYVNPLCTRYAGKEMQRIFSDDNRYSTWRRLWVALAESQQELGLDITDEQIAQMREHLNDIDYEAVAQHEVQTRHDVMAHILTFGETCPQAKPIIHLGATSCFVTDNTDIILQRQALNEIRGKLVSVIGFLADFVEEWADEPTLAYTHFQPAQPTTVGKRASLWLQDLMTDLQQLDARIANLKLLGCRGTTGTSASYLSLFEGDAEKAMKLDSLVAQKMGFNSVFAVSGQTYPRKEDYLTLSVLSGIAQSAQKFAGDIRLLSHEGEIEEPHEQTQVGSSAMAYKRNPMRCERIAALSRYVMAQAANPAMTASAQWLERTLDDSANRRLCIPEAFLATDGLLRTFGNVVQGLVVHPLVIRRNLKQELPFFATENILMTAVRAGKDRQEVHEAIRQLSMEVSQEIRDKGADNTLLERIAADERIGLDADTLESLVDASQFSGLAGTQAHNYASQVRAALAQEAPTGQSDFTLTV